ncbi:MAG: hypothetical protein ACRELF_19975, partial [Gemmataceae bacterium]
EMTSKEVQYEKGRSMKRWSRKGMAGLLVACGLGLAGSSEAGPYVNVMQPCDCPPTHYSAFHILTPSYYRWIAWCRGPSKYTFAKMLHPDTATTTYIKKYHCPSVNPLQFSIQNYPGLNGSLPRSSYQAPSDTARANPPQELPPPREEKLKQPEKLPRPHEDKEKK